METNNNLQEKEEVSKINNEIDSEKTNKVNLFSLSVVRREGTITPFKSSKITNAIRKAFLAQTDIRNNEEI